MCAAYRCAATAARSRAEATTNLACLILARPCLRQSLHDLPPTVGWWPDQTLPRSRRSRDKERPHLRGRGLSGAHNTHSRKCGFRSKAIRGAGIGSRKKKPRRSGANIEPRANLRRWSVGHDAPTLRRGKSRAVASCSSSGRGARRAARFPATTIENKPANATRSTNKRRNFSIRYRTPHQLTAYARRIR